MLVRIVQLTLVALILIVAVALRFGGLFDGLPQGHVYHPDTPKQLVAATRFMHGEFYAKTGSRDRDGYPYFNSVLCAGLRAPYYWGMRWRHRHTPARLPTPMTFEFMRVVNAVESTLAVIVIYLLVQSLAGAWAAAGASMLLAVSPIDIIACHSANGDTAAGLFGLLALLFSLRILRSGRLADYAVAVVCAVAAFSSKYYGAAAALPVVLAHLLYRPGNERHSIRSFCIPIAVMGGGALLAFFVTNPGAFTHPRATVESILAFMTYTSHFSTSAAFSEFPLPIRFVKSMALNAPYLLRVLGPVLWIAAAGLLLSRPFRKRPAYWLLASGPLFYIVVGLTMKPAIQTVYHVLITPAVIACCVLALHHLARTRWYGRSGAMVSLALFLAGVIPLANAGWRETLLFKLPDTRVLAATWMADNVPAGFATSGSKYSFWSPTGPPPERAMGMAWMRSDFREPVMPGDPRIFRIDLEAEDRLTVFRNVPTEIWVDGTTHIRTGFRPPYATLRPATHPTSLIVSDLPLLMRTDRCIRFHGHIRRTLFSRTPLDSVTFFVEAPAGRAVDINIGGQRVRLKTDTRGYAEAECAGLRRRLPYLEMGQLYRIEARTGREPVMLYMAMNTQEAAGLRTRLSASDQNPMLTDAEFLDRYGVSRPYIEALMEPPP